MKVLASLLISAALVLCLSADVFATHGEIEPAADCYGWSIDGTFIFGYSKEAYIDYSVKLMQGGELVMEHTGTGMATEAEPDVHFGGTWDIELCGDYTVEGYFHYTYSTINEGSETFEISFTCECGLVGCTYTPGFWKNHPDAWPVDNLVIGGKSYSKTEMLGILNLPTRGDLTIKLFHHLVAAILNVESGAENSVRATIDDADAFLGSHPLFSRPRRGLKSQAECLKDILAAYNELECENEEELSLYGAGNPFDNSSGEDEEGKSWGAIKMLHR